MVIICKLLWLLYDYHMWHIWLCIRCHFIRLFWFQVVGFIIFSLPYLSIVPENQVQNQIVNKYMRFVSNQRILILSWIHFELMKINKLRNCTVISSHICRLQLCLDFTRLSKRSFIYRILFIPFRKKIELTNQTNINTSNEYLKYFKVLKVHNNISVILNNKHATPVAYVKGNRSLSKN